MAKHKPNLTKADAVNEVSKSTGLGKKETLAVIEGYNAFIKDALEQKKNVQIRGFGSFIIKKKAAKKARNITKGTTIELPAHDAPGFRPCKSFIKRVKEA